jgi:hypothetical protein
LASTHFLFTVVLAEHSMVEFMTRSMIKLLSTSFKEGEQRTMFIELDFPMDHFVGCDTATMSL